MARIMESPPEFTCVIGFDGRLQELSGRWQSDLGESADALRSITCIDLVHPDDRVEMAGCLDRLTAGEVDSVEVATRVCARDGTYRRLSWKLTVDRRASLLHCRARDLADVRDGGGFDCDSVAADSVPAQAGDVIVVRDANDVVTYMSPACRSLLGYGPQDLIGRRATTFIHPDDRLLARVAHTRAMRNGDMHSLTLRYLRKDGSFVWLEDRSMSVIDAGTGALCEVQTELRETGDRSEAHLAAGRRALTDALTGLANRVLLTDRLQQRLGHLKRTPGLVGVLMLDLDHFRVINDTLGHHIGDALLVAVARRLQRLARPADTVARVGGDEFVIVVHGLARPSELALLAERIVAALQKPQRVAGEEIVTTVSVGVTSASRSDRLPGDLLREADLALHRAKDRGRARHEIYDDALQARATERLEMERLVRAAIVDGGLALEYQPIVDLATGKVLEAEALLRIDDAELGRCTPDRFLATAADAGLLPGMDRWVRLTALAQLAAWRSNPDLLRLGRVALNVSPRELASTDFASRLTALIDAHGLGGGDLSLELTEHALLQSSSSVISALASLRELGVRIGLDDFGTGYSALAHLQTFPLDFLKIDKCFVERIAADRRSSSIVAAIIALAHALGLCVVAEGIENLDQLERLRDLGCDRGQGLSFAGSLPAVGFAELLERDRASRPAARPRLRQG